MMAGLVAIAEKKGKSRVLRTIATSAPESGMTTTVRFFLGSHAPECAMYDKARALLQSAGGDK